MGDSNLQCLRRYLTLVEEDLKEAHRKQGAVDSMLYSGGRTLHSSEDLGVAIRVVDARR